MQESLIKKVIKIEDVPQITKKKTSRVKGLLVEAFHQLKEGEAAELNLDQFKVHTIVWNLNKLKRDGLIKDAKITIRRVGKNNRKAFLIREKEQIEN